MAGEPKEKGISEWEEWENCLIFIFQKSPRSLFANRDSLHYRNQSLLGESVPHSAQTLGSASGFSTKGCIEWIFHDKRSTEPLLLKNWRNFLPVFWK